MGLLDGVLNRILATLGPAAASALAKMKENATRG